MSELLQIRGLKKNYIKDGRVVEAIKGLDLNIHKGEFVGLIGESGCGKSTLARMITGLDRYDSGEILINGQKADSNIYKYVQLVFQAPQESFNPRITLGESIGEGLQNQGVNSQIVVQKTIEYLELCGLSAKFATRYPHQVSGGECQRAAIARALILNPKLIICDEPTSALDVSTQQQIIELLRSLKQTQQLACLFITHDIALAQQLCDNIAVMRTGSIVESGLSAEVINRPQSEYTKELLAVATAIYGF